MIPTLQKTGGQSQEKGEPLLGGREKTFGDHSLIRTLAYQ